jgi:thiosulfate/3-mercaptopyruvate sulfurtransferase
LALASKPVVLRAHCRIGERSSHTWFVLKELLVYPNVRNYDGSWTEYGSVIGVPIDNPAIAARELAQV